MADVLTLKVGTDHSLPLAIPGAYTTATVTAGSTVYWNDNSTVDANNNRGSITLGSSQQFIVPVWLKSAGLSSVSVTAQRASASPLALVATTGPDAFQLQNATPSILSWTAPSDGLLHRAAIYACKSVTANETGGAISVYINNASWATVLFPGGQQTTFRIASGSATAAIAVPSGATLNVVQSSALTAGFSYLFCEIWAS